MRKKANIFLALTIIIGAYIIYGLINVVRNISTYDMLDGVIVTIFFVLLCILLKILFKKYKFYSNHESLKKEELEKIRIEEELKEKKMLIPGSRERIKYLGANLCINVEHITGLPLAEGAYCFIYLCNDKVIFERNETVYNLSINKITDIVIKTDKEIQKSYVSSIGGAVGGAALFGTLGAMIGGRAKEKTSTITNNYLIFTYDNDGNVDHISFDVTNEPDGNEFVQFYQDIEKERKEVNL